MSVIAPRGSSRRMLWRSLLAFGFLASSVQGQVGVPRTQQGSPTCGLLREWVLPNGMYVLGTTDVLNSPEALTTKARLNYIVRVAELFCHTSGRYPTSYQEMISFSDGRSDSSLCNLEWSKTRDGWGHPIYFSTSQNTILLASAGADANFTTIDDVRAPGDQDPSGRTVNLARDCSP
jgi:hypothetical protein